MDYRLLEESKDTRVLVDGKIVSFKNVPIVINNEILLPYNQYLTSLGVVDDKKKLIFNSSKKSLIIIKGTVKIVITSNSNLAIINNKRVKLTIAPVIYKNTMYIPAKFFATTLNKKYVYDKSIKTVAICDAKNFNEVKITLQNSYKSMDATQRYKVNSELRSGYFGEKANFLTEKDKVNKIQYISCTEISGSSSDKETSEVYIINNNAYYKGSNNIGWTKPDTDSNSIIFIDNEASLKNISDVFIAGLVCNKNSNGIILEGDIVKNSRANSYRVNYSAHTKILIDKNTYYFKEIDVKEIWTYAEEPAEGCHEKESFILNQKYYDINSDFQVIIPSSLDTEALDQIVSTTPTYKIYSVNMKKGNSLLFTIKRDNIDLNWRVVEPFACDGYNDGISALNYTLTNKDEYELIDVNSDNLKKYGLDNPSYTVEYQTSNGKVIIYLGKKTEDNKKVYAMKENNNVFAINLLSEDILDNPLRDIVNQYVYQADLEDVSNLKVKIGDKVANCDIANDSFVVNGKDANKKNKNGYEIFRI